VNSREDDCQVLSIFRRLQKLSLTLQTVVSDCVRFYAAALRSRAALAAENLSLRKQRALFQEREKKAAPTTAADRFVFSKLARLFNWRSALVIVKPATLIGWHSNCIPPILALEIETSGETPNYPRSSDA